jgi:hypothetical protein
LTRRAGLHGECVFQLPDGRLVKHDKSFPVSEKPVDGDEGGLKASLIWHHDTLE